MNVSESPQLIVIAGPNGAGKSTLAPHLLRDTFGLLEYVNADTIAMGLSAFSPESVAFEAGRIMLERLHDLAAMKASFAFETTLASRSYAGWIHGIKDQGYAFHLLYIWLSTPELAIRRVEERVRRGGHNIPETTIRRRYLRGLHNFFALYLPLADTWTIYDNTDDNQPTFIATGTASGELSINNEAMWKTIKSTGI
jgi:predicted ABC-type ATPase